MSPTRCTCKGVLPGACNCTISDSSTSVVVAGAGSSASPFTLAAQLNASPGLLSTSAAGFKGAFPERVLRPPRAKAFYNAGPQGITNAAGGNAVSFNQPVYDTDGFWTGLTPTRLTNNLGLTALFGVGASIAFDTNGITTDDWELRLVINGTIRAKRSRRAHGGSLADGMTIYREYLFNNGDFVEVFVQQSTAGTRNVQMMRPRSPVLWMTYLSD